MASTLLKDFPQDMAIVDCETTGGKATVDRITEIAIIVVSRGEVVERWQRLINPQKSIPPWITRITGIDQGMVAEAPTFAQVVDEIASRLSGRVLVAHNARFDYGFLKNEFKRCQISLSLKTLCSVKLSRFLYSGERKHSLDALIRRFGFEVHDRHRAMDDAQVILDFFWHVQDYIDGPTIAATCDRLLKKPALPSQLDESQVNQLPDLPGVYYFYSESGRLLYVGKSVSLKNRVLSHFYSDHQNATDHKLSHQLHHIDFETTPSDFGAQIREAQAVKTLRPSLNRRLKKVTRLYQLAVYQTSGYDAIKIIAAGARPTDTVMTYGLFRSRRQAQKVLEKLVDQHTLCQALTGLDKRTRGCCFAHQLKKCLGACCQKEPPESYNLRVQKAMQALRTQQWPYPSAVIVTETHAKQNTKVHHLVNNWCYLGEIKTPDDLWSWAPLVAEVAPQETTQQGLERHEKTLIDQNEWFDIDLYFILVRFLLNPDACNQNSIQITPVEQLQPSGDWFDGA